MIDTDSFLNPTKNNLTNDEKCSDKYCMPAL